MPHQEADEAGFLRQVLDAMPSLVFVVDDDVCVVDCNAAAGALSRQEHADILRHRGGEVLHCLHSSETPAGCGRAPACRDCIIRGAVNAAIAGQATVRRRAQMQIVYGGRTDDFYALVSATPIVHQGRQLVLLVIEDIGQLAELQQIVPICMKCGKVRDDDQYWSRVKAYFQRYCGLQFSDGYCPRCLQDELERLGKSDRATEGGSTGVSGAQ